MKLEFHEFSQMFPVLEGTEFHDLVTDIKTHGQRELIVLLEGKILDGRNRYLACEVLGIEPRVREFNCIDGDPLAYVWSANVARRHLSTSQRAIAISKRLGFLHLGDRAEYQERKNGRFAGVNRIAKNSNSVVLTHDNAAKLAQVPRGTLARAREVVRHGTPNEIALVERGTKKLNTVYRTIRERRLANGERPRGVKITVPKGKTIIEWAKEAITLEKGGKPPEEAASYIGMNISSYRKLRDIISLYERRDDLPASERELVNDAIEDVLETYQVNQAHQSLIKIIDRIWGSKGPKNVKVETRKLENFDHAINSIMYSCMANFEIPQMPLERAKQVIEDLGDAQENIGHTINRIKEIYFNV